MAAQVTEPPLEDQVIDEQRLLLRNVAWHVHVSLHDSLELAGASASARSDLALVSRFVRLGENQTRLVKAYRAALR